MSKLSYLIIRLTEYKFRYETQTYNPELNGLLSDIIVYLKKQEQNND